MISNHHIIIILILQEEVMAYVNQEEEPLNDEIEDNEPESGIILKGNSERSGYSWVGHKHKH